MSSTSNHVTAQPQLGKVIQYVSANVASICVTAVLNGKAALWKVADVYFSTVCGSVYKVLGCVYC